MAATTAKAAAGDVRRDDDDSNSTHSDSDSDDDDDATTTTTTTTLTMTLPARYFFLFSQHCKHGYPHRRAAIADKKANRQEFFELLTHVHLARGHLAKSLHDLAKGLCFSGPTNSNFGAIRMLLEALGHCFFQAAEALGRARSRLGAAPQRRT